MKHQQVILAGCLLLALNEATAQQWDQGGNTITSLLDYIGCDGGSTQPLRVKTEANYNIDWYTNAVQRMRLNRSGNTTIGTDPMYSFTGSRKGFLLLSGQANAFIDPLNKAPFTRLHLVDDVGTGVPLTYAQEIGYRDWMRNGITFTGNSDQAYIGQRYAGDDNTDFVIQWTAQRSIFSLS